MSHTRSNGQGFSGRTAGKYNKLDTRIITRDFVVKAEAVAGQIDTGIKLPASTQAISAYIKVITPETTGASKALNVGVFGGTTTAFLNNTDVSGAGVVGTPVLVAQDTSVNNTIGYSFGSADFAELDCIVTLTLVVGE